MKDIVIIFHPGKINVEISGRFVIQLTCYEIESSNNSSPVNGNWFLIPKNSHRKKTRRFIISWLNKIDTPVGGKPKSQMQHNLSELDKI